MRSLSLAFLVVLTLVPVSLPAMETVYHSELGLRLTIPDGFVQVQEFDQVQELVQLDVVYAFHRPPIGDQEVGTFILVSRLGGVIGTDRGDPREMAAKRPRVTMTSGKWKEFEIEVSRTPQQLGDIQLLTFNAQVPLAPEAIQVTVSGEAGREDELRDILRSILGRLDGQTNWLTAEERSTLFNKAIVQLVIMVGVLALVGYVWRAIRRRRSSSGRMELPRM